MGKSYTELRKEFEQEWAKNLKLYIKAGMSPEFIAAMREFDEEVFRKERTFQDKTPSRIEYWDDPRLDILFPAQERPGHPVGEHLTRPVPKGDHAG